MTGDDVPPGCHRGRARDGKCCPHVATDLQHSRRGTSEKLGSKETGSTPTAGVARCRLTSSTHKHLPWACVWATAMLDTTAVSACALPGAHAASADGTCKFADDAGAP